MSLALSLLFPWCLLTAGAPGDWRPPELKVKAPPPVQNFEELRKIAFQYLGRSYSMGGVGSPAFDCSGFVCRVYAEAGYALPRVSRDQAHAGEKVSLGALKPGDLLFFAQAGQRISHVGIYLGEDQLVHASSGKGEVTVAQLSSRWFRTRLVGARRVLTSSTSSSSYSLPVAKLNRPPKLLAPVRELKEHGGSNRLLPMLRRPPQKPLPHLGPKLFFTHQSAISLSAMVVTEDQQAGGIVVPRVKLRVPEWGATAELAAWLRYDEENRATLGEYQEFADYLRFLQQLRVGLPGADFEFSLARSDDLGLKVGELMKGYNPGFSVAGVSGLNLKPGPLSGYVAYRQKRNQLEVLTTDVSRLGIWGVAGRYELIPKLSVGAAWVSDPTANYLGNQRTINAWAADIVWHLLDSRKWTISLFAEHEGQQALGLLGAGAHLGGDLELRFGPWRRYSVRFAARAGFLGSQHLAGLFGPSYAIDSEAHLAVLSGLQERPVVSFLLGFSRGRVRGFARYAQALSSQQRAMDRQLAAFLEWSAIHLGRGRWLDLRASYQGRAPFHEEKGLHVAQAGLRLRFSSWFSAEVYLQKGETFHGGGGLTVTWVP